METDKDMYKFFIEFVFLDHSLVDLDENVIVLRKYIIKRFHKAVPPSKILKTLSLIDDIIFKLHNRNLEKKDHIYSVRENVLYILFCEKFEEKNPVGDDNDDDNDDDDDKRQ